jgi:demethylmenaquinone methyltransferase/2-methoxy-6-polyprenyl-1,4-benzoquinol methylase
MANMFDQVSPRYDLLNGIMTLGRDRAWRRALWQRVPESTQIVLDLCTGNGASLPGLRRPGRLVLGIDLSLGMLELARSDESRAGWAPRLVCADALRLPIRDLSLDCVTIAFGIRNLRPRLAALAELARALKPGGCLIVLEATAPRPGPTRALHAFYLKRIVPLAGHLSSEPSAYAYLSRSIEEFGSGPEFEADLGRSGFDLIERQSFLFGATRLWVARRSDPRRVTPGVPGMHPARMGEVPRGEMPTRDDQVGAEWRWWNAVQLILSAALVAALAYALWKFWQTRLDLPLAGWQRQIMVVLLIVGIMGFTARTVLLWLRLLGPPPPRI